MTSLGATGVRGLTRPVRPAEGRAPTDAPAVSSPVAPLQQACAYLLWRDCGFDHQQARALAQGGYVAVGWRRVE